MVRLFILITCLLTSPLKADTKACKELTKKEFLSELKTNNYSKIVFFATWCHSCLPKLKKLDGSELLVMAFDKKEKAEEALKTLAIKNKCFYGDEIIEHYKLKSLPFEIKL